MDDFLSAPDRPNPTPSRWCFLIATLLLTGCSWANEFEWANEEQIIEAAKRCGVEHLKPTPAGDAWAAYVPKSVSNAQAKEDCIYADLKHQGLLVTR